ncbi:hypothetical protein CAOG_01993 [Capsaspora owczarzaki ATCC 30864]|nr:hypothetical protein CAOG_01993 [Capsaspora owczarzaki ATCC 30864]|eukprot:XP_004364861.2 hypothetical protein CAOG_01993 [Capsaspora owczarzaki ATCC 30864]
MTSFHTPPNWTYSMRRTMQEVQPGIYLGPFGCVKGPDSPALLESANITHLVSVGTSMETYWLRTQFAGLKPILNVIECNPVGSSREQLAALAYAAANEGRQTRFVPEEGDQDKPNWLVTWLPSFVQFVNRAINSGGNVLVFCSTGISSSPALLVAYLMARDMITYRDALEQLAARRFCITISPELEYKLRLLEYLLDTRQLSFEQMDGPAQNRARRTIGTEAEEEMQDAERYAARARIEGSDEVFMEHGMNGMYAAANYM